MPIIIRIPSAATTPKASGVSNLAKIMLETGATSLATTSPTVDHLVAVRTLAFNDLGISLLYAVVMVTV